ncbi:unnamed protein product [Adineta steineri]|uniref:Uncharacterized protein n=2 Tax=Adineta steineri TaxID=433720 RepID=A0A815BF99_9BILA|nr:unnamed protein product [Adineta steineri]
MHLSIRRANQNHTQKLSHINNHTFMRFVKKYYIVLLKKVRPIHPKYKEIEEDVLEQDQKFILLDNRSQALQAHLRDVSQQ